MGGFKSLLGGLGGLFGGSVGGGGFGSALSGLFGGGDKGGGGGGGMSGGFNPLGMGSFNMGNQQPANFMNYAMNNPATNFTFGGGGSGSSGAFGGLDSLFGKNPILSGLGTLFGSQLVKNPKLPKLPDSFNQFQQQAQAGGTQLGQQSNQYLQTLLSGQNTSANDAATHSLDLNYQEQLRQLNGMYKSLRPGTDPTSDTTYQRDLNNLNDMYSRQRAQTLAQQQIGAAQQGQAASVNSMNQQAQAVQTQVEQLAAQYGLDAQTQSSLRNILMNVGGDLLNYGTLSQILPMLAA